MTKSIWDEKPGTFEFVEHDVPVYYAEAMDAWLVKVKAKGNRLREEGLEHYAIGVEYYEKIEAVKTWMETIEQRPYTFNETIMVHMSEMAELEKILEDKICLHCHMPIKIRNPSGYCDHLYYPENCPVCQELNKEEAEK